MPGPVTSALPGAHFVGARGSGKFLLIRGLIGGHQVDKDHASPYCLVLDTKYYTAGVACTAALPRPADLGACEALVLVFDATCEASFTAVASWHAQHEEQTADAGVRLAVATKLDLVKPGAPREPWLQAVQEWCSEQLFEYVETAAAAPQLDQLLELDGDRQGVARVLEALQVGGRRRWLGNQPPPPPPRPPAAAWAPRPPALHGTAMTRVHAGGARAAWRAGPDGAAGRIACHAGAPLAGPGDEAPPLRQRRRSAAAQHSGQRGGIAWHGGRQLPTTVGRAGCGGGGGATSSGGRSRRVGSSDARRATTPCGGRCRPARHLSSSQGRPAPRVPWQQRCSDRPGRDRGRAVGAHAA